MCVCAVGPYSMCWLLLYSSRLLHELTICLSYVRILFIGRCNSLGRRSISGLACRLMLNDGGDGLTKVDGLLLSHSAPLRRDTFVESPNSSPAQLLICLTIFPSIFHRSHCYKDSHTTSGAALFMTSCPVDSDKYAPAQSLCWVSPSLPCGSGC